MKNNPNDMLVLNFIHAHCLTWGYSPTRKEIATELLNGHTNGSQHYILKLKKDELINVGDKGHRAIGLTDKGIQALKEWGAANESDDGKTP